MNAQNGLSHSNVHINDLKQEVSHEMQLNGGNGSIGANGYDASEETEPEVNLDISISNVVSNFSVRCHLNLRQVACNGSNVVYRREQSMVLMKLRSPRVTASIWSSGKITCTGANTEDSAKLGARRVARVLQKMGFKCRFTGFRIVNVLGTCIMPFGIKIHEFSDQNRPNASYEPELHPGATYRMKDIKAVLKVFQTGAITITAPNVSAVQSAVERIYPLVVEYRKPKPPQSSLKPNLNKTNSKSGQNRSSMKNELESDEELDREFTDEDEAPFSESDEDDPDDYSDKSD